MQTPVDQPTIQNQLGAVRRSRGIGASDLARRVGISRQTVYAIEAGSYVPNTEVALKLARELEVPVENLFSLRTGEPPAFRSIRSEVLSETPLAAGQAVRICQVGGQVIGVPVNASPYYLPEADAVVADAGSSGPAVELVMFAEEENSAKKLILAGCDPAIGLVSGMVEKLGGVELISAGASSKLALQWLKEGKVHIAGSHLEDPDTGEFNLPFLRREFPGEDFAVITFARWEQGFVTARGNPKDIRDIGSLARSRVRFINREQGSGSRALLDRLLKEADISAAKVNGYDRIAYGHLPVAYAVLSGAADYCLATHSAARTFGLSFIPLQSERYDFVMRRQTLETPAAQTFADVLQRAVLRRKLEILAGYDTTRTGAMLA